MNETRASGLEAVLLDPQIQIAGLTKWLQDAIEVSSALDPSHLSVLVAQVADLADCAADSLACTATRLRAIAYD